MTAPPGEPRSIHFMSSADTHSTLTPESTRNAESEDSRRFVVSAHRLGAAESSPHYGVSFSKYPAFADSFEIAAAYKSAVNSREKSRDEFSGCRSVSRDFHSWQFKISLSNCLNPQPVHGDRWRPTLWIRGVLSEVCLHPRP